VCPTTRPKNRPECGSHYQVLNPPVMAVILLYAGGIGAGLSIGKLGVIVDKLCTVRMYFAQLLLRGLARARM
jgi:hypothetical protein